VGVTFTTRGFRNSLDDACMEKLPAYVPMTA